MGHNPNDLIAAVRIDAFTDTVLESFGVNLASFTVVQPRAAWRLEYEPSELVIASDAQIVAFSAAAQNRIIGAQGTIFFVPVFVAGLFVWSIDPLTGLLATSASPITVTVRNVFGGLTKL